jgi:protein involved in polysaccharide export with SLBB domain
MSNSSSHGFMARLFSVAIFATASACLMISPVSAADMAGAPGSDAAALPSSSANSNAGATVLPGSASGATSALIRKLSSTETNGIAKQLGATPKDLSRLNTAITSGAALNSDEIEKLSVRLGAKNMGPEEVEAIGTQMGLSATELAQLKARIGNSKGSRKASGSEHADRSKNGVHLTDQEAPMEASPTATAALGVLSSIEKAFRKLDSEQPPEPTTPEDLEQFGYSLFSSPVSTFAPTDAIPVGPDYLVGPGDELKIALWGRMNEQYVVKVERNGEILVPQLGPVQVAGLTFSQAKHLIEGRAAQITGVQVEVTMGQLRTIQVFVMGEVKQPGAFTISSLSRISNALVAAGGISKVGSLRKIQLRRGNQTIKVLDLYDVLLRGDTANDTRLEPQDVIFIPVIGQVAAIAGDVKRPAIYELAPREENLNGLIALAGGVTAFGYTQRVQVLRVENHVRRTVLDVDLEKLRKENYGIRDGDLTKIFPVLPGQSNALKLIGNVPRPGKYEFSSGMKVADLLRQGEGVLPRTFFKYALIKRLDGTDRSVRFVPVDLEGVLSGPAVGAANIELQPGDELSVFNQDEMKDLPAVKVSGEVRNPGAYEMSRGMHVSDLVYLSGGLRDSAYQTQAELARTQVVEGEKTRHTYMDINLRAALTGPGPDDLALQPNDELFIRSAPGWHLPWVVKISGRVLRPGPYTIREGERVDSLLARCGGLTADAYPPGAVFFRQSVKETEQKRLDESRARLSQSIAQLQLYSVQPDAPQQTGNNAGQKAEALQFLHTIMDQSAAIQADGRVVIHLSAAEQFTKSTDNIQLESDDELVIPRRPSSVNVLGQVYSPTAIVFQEGVTVRDYLSRAGGANQLADRDNVMVIKADGSTMTDDGVRDSGKNHIFPLLPVISGGLMDARLAPGDTVYVPEKLIYVNKTQVAKDVATIIGQTATALGVLGLLATR